MHQSNAHAPRSRRVLDGIGMRPTRDWAAPILFLFVILALGASCAAGPREAVFPLSALEGFTQVGTATITDTDDGIMVHVSVSPGPADNDPQPMHIHLGSCGPNLGSWSSCSRV